MSITITPSQLADRAEFYHQLGSMVSAGVGLPKALEYVATNPPAYSYRQPLLQICQYIQSGYTFTQALSQIKGWLPSFDIALLAAGEQSGRLDFAFKLLASYYKSRAKILRDMLGGMFFTMLTFHFALLIFPLSFLVGAIVDGKWITFLIEKMAVYGTLYGVVFLLVFAAQGQHGERWRSLIEDFCDFVPMLGIARRYLALSRLAISLQSLITAGITIIPAWDLAAVASGSPSLRRSISSWIPRMESGSTPSEMVRTTRRFPSMFANLYHSAEISGGLDDALVRLHAFYEEEGFRKMQMFIRLFNFLLYILIAGAIGWQVISFYVGYYNNMMNQF